MKRDRFFNSDRHGSGDNGGGRRPTRRSNRMPEPGPEPEDEKTWNELERENEIAHYEKLGRSMQKGVQMEAERQAPSAQPLGYSEEQLEDIRLAVDVASKHVKAVEANVRSELEAQQAVALSQRPTAVDVSEPEVGKGNMVALGVGAFVAGGVLGFLIGRSTR